MKNKLRKLIMELCEKTPKPNKDWIILFVISEAKKMKSMSDQEIDDWVEVITELVNNYY
jgi:hypothetical protein